MKRTRSLCLMATVLLAGCVVRLNDYHGYHGDGTFTPHAAPGWICQDGYSVDLGAIDLSAPSQATHQLEGLPPMKAVIGLQTHRRGQVSGVPHAADALRGPEAVIDISLTDEHGRRVFLRQEQLSTWAGSATFGDVEQAFLYRRGPTFEVPQPSGGVRVEPINVGADDGWGTYFTPRRDGRYTLHFAVLEPDPNLAGFDVRLVVEGVVGCL